MDLGNFGPVDFMKLEAMRTAKCFELFDALDRWIVGRCGSLDAL